MHDCEYKFKGGVKACGEPAPHPLSSPDGDVLMWLCSFHYDLLAEGLRQAAEWDDGKFGPLFAEVVKKNRL